MAIIAYHNFQAAAFLAPTIVRNLRDAGLANQFSNGRILRCQQIGLSMSRV